MKVVVLLNCSTCLYGLILWALSIVHGIDCLDYCCSTFCDDFDFATVKIMLYSSDDGLLSDHVFVADSATVKTMLSTVKMLLSSIDDCAQLMIVSNFLYACDC